MATSVFSKNTNTSHSSSQHDKGNDSFFGIQAKLSIGKSNDKYEVEADRVADQVVANKQNKTTDSFFAPLPTVQKKLANEVQKQDDQNKEIQQKTVAETITPVVQLKADKHQNNESFFSPKNLIQNKEEKIQKTEETIQNKKEVKKLDTVTTNTAFLKPVVQSKTEEEVQKKEDTHQDEKQQEIQQKTIVETITPVVQTKAEVTPIKADLPKAEITAAPAPPKPVTIQPKPEEEIQKKEEETQAKDDDQKLQMSAAGDTNPGNNNNLESNLNNSKSGGSPLSENTKNEMESGFGTNFSQVKIHTDSSAVQMNKQLGSQAFANGNHIYFNEGKYNPNSQSGKHLLAHELTHTVQQGASVRKKTETIQTSEMIQTSILSSLIPDFIKNNVRHVPGYTLLTVIAGYDPLNDVNVARNAINLIEGFMGLIPFGTAIFDKLQEYGIIDRVFDWVNGKLNELGLNMDALLKLVQDAWDESSLTTFIDVVTDKFNEVVHRVTSFATSLVDQIMTWIKEALIEVAEPLLAENKAWSLIKKIIKYDPLRDQEVSATTVEILEDFLKLIGKETELEQMREKGTLQETADWLDTQVGTFMSLLGELGGLIDDAWNAIQPSNLANIVDNLSSLATRAGNFLERVWDFAVGVALKVLELVKKSLLGWLSSQASSVRGYSLIKVIIGKDPFTEQAVPFTIPNVIKGFMSLMEGGDAQYAQMEETGAIARIVGQIEAAVATLNMTPVYIVQLFTDLWNSFTIDDLIHPLDAFIRIIEKFGEPIGRLIAFVAEIIRIVIVAILEIMNFPFDLISNIINRAMGAIEDIKRDPIGFLKNILRAIRQGFKQFFDNIVTHLLGGLTGWLMSELQDANVPILTDFSLRGVISWVLEVLGISIEKIWEKLAAHPRIGPARVARIRSVINTLEGIWTFIKDVQERGMAAIWDKIQEQLSNLWNTVLDAVKNFVMEQIINRITARLLSMLDPTGIMAVINGAMALYSAIQSFIKYLREMLEVVNSFVNGVADVAKGNVTTAANYLERTMGRAMPVVIGFLANQVGLSGIGRRIGTLIESARELVDQALTWLVNQAVDRGMALLDRVMGRGGADGLTTVRQNLHQEEQTHLTNGGITHQNAQTVAQTVATRNANLVSAIQVVDGGSKWNYNLIQRVAEEGKNKAESNTTSGSIRQRAEQAGLTGVTLSHIETAWNAYQNELFSRAQLQGILGLSEASTRSHLASWVTKTLIFPFRSNTRDTEGQYSFENKGNRTASRESGETDYDQLIEKYKTMYREILGSNRVLEWVTTWSDAEKRTKIETYRENFRDLVVEKHINSLHNLDEQVVKSSHIPSELNAVRGVIFELWLEQKGVMRRTPRPMFLKDYYDSKKLTQNRDADGFDGSDIVEAKAISVDRNPSADEQTQMTDYKNILTSPKIPWVKSKDEKIEFNKVKYNFTRETIKDQWTPFLQRLIGGSKWEANVQS